MAYGFNWSKKPDPAIDKACKRRDDAAKARKNKRMEDLKRKYHDVPFHHAVLLLFWREGRLTIDDIAKILETDSDTVRFEVDKIRQDAR